VPFTASERATLRARAEQARGRARALAAQSLVLKANARGHFKDAAARAAVANELRNRLQEITARNARLSRALGEPAEQTVIRVKEAAAEAIAIAKTKTRAIDPIEAQLLREQLVRWTIDAYFSTGPLSS
jgi:hypothetical protein